MTSLTTLLALDERHPELLRGIFQRCAAATHDEVHSAGRLHTALCGEELLLEDARAERDERRAERGYVSAADARAFLALARTPPRSEVASWVVNTDAATTSSRLSPPDLQPTGSLEKALLPAFSAPRQC